eukprot:TRINITY_DN5671_c0_g1_i1.p1 TRINITY_DN5671_c0_g1~~TRINITY_DN5671_c0_g1_i1.p1  ORF type:complete len:610 (+),score=131.21 TRINITY_DN5671_c0_g1_i1:51-1880(+)
MESLLEPISIFNPSRLVVGLSWNTGTKDIDLDASCFIFDTSGNVLDVVYFNQLKSRDGAVTHSGDEKTGLREGLDEVITVLPYSLHPSVQFLIFVVTVHTSDLTFDHVNDAHCFAWDGTGYEIVQYSISAQGSQRAMVMSMVARLQGVWYFYRIGQPSFASSLNAIVPDLDKTLARVIPPSVLKQRVLKKVDVNLYKGNTIPLSRMQKVYLGLGWDAGFDLDAYCYLSGQEGESIDTVYFGKLISDCGSVKHSGDNLTGQGEGDDERIKVDLSSLPASVWFLFFVVKIYSASCTFKDVKNPFVRLVDECVERNLCVYKPKKVAKHSNALVVCTLYKHKLGTWHFKAVGHPEDKNEITHSKLFNCFRADLGRKLLLKALVVGSSGAGKTCLINYYISDKFIADYQTTIGVGFSTKLLDWDENTTVTLQLWDIIGQDRFANMVRSYYSGAKGALVVFDVVDKNSMNNAYSWKKDIDEKLNFSEDQDTCNSPRHRQIPIILLANKMDLVVDVNERQRLREEINRFSSTHGFFTWFETSAKDGFGVHEAIMCLTRLMMEIFESEGEEVEEGLEGGGCENGVDDGRILLGEDPWCRTSAKEIPSADSQVGDSCC